MCVRCVDVVYNLQSHLECCIRGASSGSCHSDEERRCRFYLIMHLSVFDVIFFVIHVCWRCCCCCCCRVAVPSSSSLFIQFQFNYFEYYIWKFLPFFPLSTLFPAYIFFLLSPWRRIIWKYTNFDDFSYGYVKYNCDWDSNIRNENEENVLEHVICWAIHVWLWPSHRNSSLFSAVFKSIIH